MLTTNFKPGMPTWVDLGSSDIAASQSFYENLMGWTFEPGPPEAGGYGMFRRDGKVVAGLGPCMEEGDKPAWTIFFHTDDAAATTQKVRAAGGTVRQEPMEVFTAGTLAAFTDPTGSEFAVWQGKDTKGLDMVTSPGSLSWTENYTTDAATACTFYTDLFGWTYEEEELDVEGIGPLILMSTAGTPGREGHQGDMLQLPSSMLVGGVPYWQPYFEVEDCTASGPIAVKLGASYMVEPTYKDGIGMYSILIDPQGAKFALLTSPLHRA